MATTKQPAVYDCHVSFAAERPRLFIDCGFKAFSVWFDDTEQLARDLDAAVKHSGMPWRAAEAGLRKAHAEIGSYVTWECDRHIVNDYVPAEPAPWGTLSGVGFFAVLIVSAGLMLAAVAKVAECCWYLFG